MPNARIELDRVTWGRHMNRPIVTAQRAERQQELKRRISQGEGDTEKLNADDGTPFFIFGVTPFTDDYTI